MIAAKHAARGYEAVLREAQVQQQQGECPACGGKLTKANAASDHCHRTGLPRQTLCRRCNSAVGTLETRGEQAALAVLTAGRKKPHQILAAMRAYVAAWAGRHAEQMQRTEGHAIGKKQAAAMALVWALDDLMKYSASTTTALLRTDGGKAKAMAMFTGAAAGISCLK
jgi:uncharacterized protein with PIN domain